MKRVVTAIISSPPTLVMITRSNRNASRKEYEEKGFQGRDEWNVLGSGGRTRSDLKSRHKSGWAITENLKGGGSMVSVSWTCLLSPSLLRVTRSPGIHRKRPWRQTAASISQRWNPRLLPPLFQAARCWTTSQSDHRWSFQSLHPLKLNHMIKVK